jgi:hypothetical protein
MFVLYDGAVDTGSLKIHTGLEFEIPLKILSTILFTVYFSYFFRNCYTSRPFIFSLLECTLTIISHCTRNSFHMNEY